MSLAKPKLVFHYTTFCASHGNYPVEVVIVHSGNIHLIVVFFIGGSLTVFVRSSLIKCSFLYVFHRLDRCSYHSPWLTALSDISWFYCELLDESSMVMDYHTAHKDHTPGQDVQHTKVLSSSTQNSV